MGVSFDVEIPILWSALRLRKIEFGAGGLAARLGCVSCLCTLAALPVIQRACSLLPPTPVKSCRELRQRAQPLLRDSGPRSTCPIEYQTGHPINQIPVTSQMRASQDVSSLVRAGSRRSEEHTSELQSRGQLVC